MSNSLEDIVEKLQEASETAASCAEELREVVVMARTRGDVRKYAAKAAHTAERLEYDIQDIAENLLLQSPTS